MAFDAIFLAAVLGELEAAVGMKIDKIRQPERDRLLFHLRGPGASERLLILARPGSGRIHFTQEKWENPQQPPMFCMLLRKHLQGARIAAVTQPPMERIVRIETDAFNEMGEPVKKYIIAEFLGRYANIILADSEDIIIDALRRVDEEMSRNRRILPGLKYRLPPGQGKQNLLTVGREERRALFEAASAGETDKWLLDTFFGLSPLICRELSGRAAGSVDMGTDGSARSQAFLDGLTAFIEMVEGKAFRPYLLVDGDAPFDFSYMPIYQYGGRLKEMDTFSALLDAYYSAKDRTDSLRQRAGALVKTVTARRDRLERKLAAQRLELAAAENGGHWRELGDIVTANLYRMKKGQCRLVADNFHHEEGEEVAIALDPLKSPAQNAQQYYKRYTKAQNAQKNLEIQIQKGELELSYLSSILEAMSRAETNQDMAEIRQELKAAGVLRSRKNEKREKVVSSGPMVCRSSAGLEILAGKNNTQNDKLTFRTAYKSDLWLHTQKLHGAHVILRCGGAEPDQRSIEEAAAVAAYYSQGREGRKIPVDYTRVKNVKRPPGGRAGMAVYTDYHTIYVNPDGKMAET